jgi:hypothetical protein
MEAGDVPKPLPWWGLNIYQAAACSGKRVERERAGW